MRSISVQSRVGEGEEIVLSTGLWRWGEAGGRGRRCFLPWLTSLEWQLLLLLLVTAQHELGLVVLGHREQHGLLVPHSPLTTRNGNTSGRRGVVSLLSPPDVLLGMVLPLPGERGHTGVHSKTAPGDDAPLTLP